MLFYTGRVALSSFHAGGRDRNQPLKKVSRRRGAVVLLLIAIGAALTNGQELPRPPNVVLIISDDHAWGDYSFMGHPQIQTPQLDKLAAQSLVYRRGYVPSSLCCPSLASIITGLYPHQHKITSNDPPMPPGAKLGEAQNLAAFRQGREAMNQSLEAVATLPRLLARRGYVSLQTGKWWQGAYSRGGFSHGMTQGTRHGDAGLKIGRETMQPVWDFIDTAIQQQKPFFIWYAPMMPHAPHTPPQRVLDKYTHQTNSLHLARYWAMVEWFDESCGSLLEHLDRLNLSQNTMVLYVTDNGWIQDPNSPRFASKSKQSPYDGGLRTPIMIRWPDKVTPRHSNDLGSSIDLVPTILAAVGIKPTRQMQGVNLLDPRAVRKRKVIFGECFTHNAVALNDPASSLRWRWLIERKWKLIVPFPPNEPDLKVELYNLMDDPHERLNLAQERPKQVRSLHRKLDRWWKP